MAKLKVFTWSDGFHAFTVATSSRPRALQAWGSTQDLFKTGLASEITEGPDHDAALASPGEVIRTGQAVDPGVTSTVRKPGPSKVDKAAQTARRRARARLEKLEAEMVALKAVQAREKVVLERRREALEAEAQRLEAEQDRAVRALRKKIEAARKAA